MLSLRSKFTRMIVTVSAIPAAHVAAQCTPYWSKVQSGPAFTQGYCLYADHTVGGSRLYYGSNNNFHVFDPASGAWQILSWVGPGSEVRYVGRLQIGAMSDLWVADRSRLYRVDDSSGQATLVSTSIFTNRLTVYNSAGEPAILVAGTVGGVQRPSGFYWTQLVQYRASGCIPIPVVEWDDGTGSALFCGGGFRSARVNTPGSPEVFTSGVIKYDGTSVQALEDGLLSTEAECGAPSFILDIAVFDDGTGEALYAGGDFDISGADPMAMIARWDGGSWSAVGGSYLREPHWYIERLRVLDLGDGPALYAAGFFDEIGGVPAGGIAKWDGANWHGFDGGSSSSNPANLGVTDAAAFEDADGMALYVSGFFTSIGGTNAQGIARYGCRCPDLSGDGAVDLADLAIVLSTFGGPSGGNDVDRDGDSDLYDLSILLSYFGQTCE